MFQFLQHTLIPRVVGDDQHKLFNRLNHLSLFFDRQDAAIVTQRMNNDGGVFSRLHDLIQIDDGAMLNAESQRPIDPDRLLPFEQIPSDEIGRGKIFMAGHRNERAS